MIISMHFCIKYSKRIHNFLIYRPIMKEHMKYIIDHSEEIEKLIKVKAQVSEVKSIMLENVDKVSYLLRENAYFYWIFSISFTLVYGTLYYICFKHLHFCSSIFLTTCCNSTSSGNIITGSSWFSFFFIFNFVSSFFLFIRKVFAMIGGAPTTTALWPQF